MIKSAIFLSLCSGTSLFAGTQLPYFIDFGTEEFATHFFYEEFVPEQVTSCPFNCASELSTFFAYVRDEYNIRTVVETGTFKGNTTAFFGSCFDTVHTIEIAPIFYEESSAYLKSFANVHCHFGSSPDVLNEILPSMSNEPVLFYLDAHWYEDWPLLNELAEISKTHKDNCIIVIDDFKVPGRKDIPYDTHGVNGIYEYSFEYVKNHLQEIFSEYTIHYLIPKHVQARAKFVAIPKTMTIE
jgi:hypothetical protein